eukprot:GHVL01041741.1.p1 GENE.GHVL01041741.1~~GHVL01041741.1.p1  ORF type:complete len:352 (-),score=79.61 GHVL01041741.1:1245-2300(-)
MEAYSTDVIDAGKKRKLDNPTGEERRSAFASCPCYLKFLVNNIAAGSIIGKSGSEIAAIEQQTEACMKLSPAGKYYPGTQERIVVVGGSQESLAAALRIIMNKVEQSLSMSSTEESSVLRCRLVVPNSAVSCIIGRQGQSIKQLQEQTGARTQISQRDDNMKERIVNITGTTHQILSAVTTISAAIQSDPNVSEHINVLYNDVPHASYQGSSAAPQQAPHHAPIADPYGGMYGPPTYAYRPYPYDPYASAAGYAAQSAAVVSPDIMNASCEIEVHVPDSQVGLLIGKSGSVFNEIQQQSGAKLQVSQKGDLIPNTQNRRVQVMGTVQAVHSAHIIILQKLAAERNNGVSAY